MLTECKVQNPGTHQTNPAKVTCAERKYSGDNDMNGGERRQEAATHYYEYNELMRASSWGQTAPPDVPSEAATSSRVEDPFESR